MYAGFKFSVQFATAALLFAALSLSARAADPVSRGRDLALVACTYCHIVEDNQQVKPVINVKLPTFQEVADRPDTTPQSLRVFLRTQHTEKPSTLKMPNPALNDDQIEDVVAYIVSRRKMHRTNFAVPSLGEWRK
jgi:mono/diheme cytochrome c family protein